MIVIGIDPDSKKHGVAVYLDGGLIGLESLELFKIYTDIVNVYRSDGILFSIEDVCANNFIYSRNETKNKKKDQAIIRSVGKCQQAQVELMRMLTSLDVKYVLHKPQKGNWAKNRKQFERVTGWTKQSNEDTRAAAYFGFLALK